MKEDHVSDERHVFDVIWERAVARKGETFVEAQSAVLSERADDAHVLSAISRAVFYTGFSWSMVDRKWPAFEQAFEGFEPGWLNIQPDEFWDERMRDASNI